MNYLVIGKENLNKLLEKGFTQVNSKSFHIDTPDAYIVCPPKSKFNFSEVEDVPMKEIPMTL